MATYFLQLWRRSKVADLTYASSIQIPSSWHIFCWGCLCTLACGKCTYCSNFGRVSLLPLCNPAGSSLALHNMNSHPSSTVANIHNHLRVQGGEHLT
ncbi:hypothetical protein T439DRAFT_75806 [Meredithblackwellia eburnea MCA 4105]